jgi:polyisoprenoid-binding protein YceI
MRTVRSGVIAIVAGLVILPATLSAQAKTFTKPPVGSGWRIDAQHSEVGFRIRHMVGRVRGMFTDWDGLLVTHDKDWTHGTVNVTVRTRSVDTRNEARDADLRSTRFFSVDSFPTMTFESTGLIATNSAFEMGGLLTIKGHTHPVTFRGQYRGIERDANGKERIAFDGTALINRQDFGLTWNQALETGTLLSDDVELEIAVEAVRQ